MNIRSFLRTKKYSTKIFLWITSLMLVSTAVLSTVVYLNVESTVFGNEYETSQKILSQMKYNIDYMDEMVKNLCLSTYYNEDVKSLMNLSDDETFEQMSIINKLSNSVVASNSFIHSIYVYNNRKKVYYSTYNTFRYNDPELTKVIQSYDKVPALTPVLRKMETYHSGELVKYDNVLTYFMYELTDNNNNMNGAVIVNVKLDWLISNIRAISMVSSKRQDEIFILDNKGEFIQNSMNSSPDNEGFEKYIKELYSSRKADGTAEGSGMTTGNIGGKDYIISYIPINAVNWVVFKVQSYNMVFDYINKLKYTIIVITVVLLALIIIAAYTLSRGLYKPFEGLLKLVGFNGKTSAAGKKDGDEFSYLQEVYRDSIEKLGKYSSEKQSNEKIIKLYLLRKLLFHSSSITSQEFENSRQEHDIKLSPDGPFLIILLVLDRHREFEENNDAKTRELLKFAVTNITSEILSTFFRHEAVEMKNDEIAFIVNVEEGTPAEYGQLADLLREAQNKVLEYYKISFTAVISEKTDKMGELTIIYNRVVNNVVYRFIFGSMSVINPEMLKKNLTAVYHDYNYESHKKLIEDIKRGDLESAETRLAGLLEDVRKKEYNDIMLSLAHLVNTIRDTVYEMNQKLKEPVNINALLSNNEIFEMETIDEFHKILSGIIRQVLVSAEPTADSRDLQTAETIRQMILSGYSDYNLSASGIAGQLKMSPGKIGKIFRENFNMSIPEYANNVRLAKAVEWMENSKLSVGEIMFKVGIENESYFYKIFRAKYGTTPRDFIARNMLK